VHLELFAGPALLFLAYLCAHPLFLLSELGSELSPEVFRLKDLTNLDLALSIMGIRASFDPLDRLLL